jgi:hypothetical protein
MCLVIAFRPNSPATWTAAIGPNTFDHSRKPLSGHEFGRARALRRTLHRYADVAFVYRAAGVRDHEIRLHFRGIDTQDMAGTNIFKQHFSMSPLIRNQPFNRILRT